MSLWLIACRYTGENLIGDCVASIREHHPGDRILVVDSCSDDLSYLQHLGCDIATGNSHYPVGAWRYARGIPWDFAYFIHDSTRVVGNMAHIETEPCSVFSTFPAQYGDDLRPYIGRTLDKLHIEEPDEWRGVTGPMLMCQRPVFQELRGAGLFSALPTSKLESNGWERILGMMLTHLDIPIAHEVAPWMEKLYRERV